MSYTRRTFMAQCGAGTAALAAAATLGAGDPATRRRNILLYVVDDLGMDDAGCYGHPSVRTPAVDALAADGVRFTHSFCTSPSCSPSRSVILTGLHNHANGQYGLAHDYHHFLSLPGFTSLPVRLQEAGYRTCSAGKLHLAPKDFYRFEQYVNHEMAEGHASVPMAEGCRPFLASDDPRPFFLYFCTTQPHRPFRREGAAPVRPEDVVVPSWLPDTPECRDELARYYGSTEVADQGLQKLIELLHETGHWEDTLVVFISDNGIAFPGAKTNMYEPGVRLPCVVRNPYGSRRGVTCDAMITWADLTPTLLDFAGALPVDNPFHGRSFLSAMEEERPAGWDEVFLSHSLHEVTMYYPMRVARTRRHKLIWNIAHGLSFPFASDLWESETWQATLRDGRERYGQRTVDAYLHRPPFELYDLAEDPGEVDNLADRPEAAAILAELKGKLKAFQERTKDPWLIKWEHE